MTTRFRQVAEEILNITKYNNNETEIQNLAEQIELVDLHGMGDLNQILLQNARGSGRNIPDFIAEHNFGTDLIRKDPQGLFLYEPPKYNRPIDFVLPRHSTTFFMQMKRLSDSEFENRRNNMLRRIRTYFEAIAVSKMVSIEFSEDFSEQDVEPLVRFIEPIAQANDLSKHYYPDSINPKAAFILFNPHTKLTHLSLGASSDMVWRDLTGEAEAQIRSSIDKAVGAFAWNNDLQHVNLIVMEADQYDDIDISQALFGTETYQVNQRGTLVGANRGTDGYFYDPRHKDKICGVIALRRTDHRFISRYQKTLFINEQFESYVDLVRQVVEIDQVLTVRDLP